MRVLVRTVVRSSVLATLFACGPGEEQLAIQEIHPSSIGARSASFNLSVVGSGFHAESAIVLGGLEFKPTAAGAHFLHGQIPGGTAGTTSPGTLAVSVKNPDGTRAKEVSLVVTEAPAPVLTHIYADLCDHADPISFTLRGANFTVDSSLEINGQAAPISSLTREIISVSAARAALGGDPLFKVTVPGPGGGVVSMDLPIFLGCD